MKWEDSEGWIFLNGKKKEGKVMLIKAKFKCPVSLRKCLVTSQLDWSIKQSVQILPLLGEHLMHKYIVYMSTQMCKGLCTNMHVHAFSYFRSVQNISSRFEYPKNWLHSLDVTTYNMSRYSLLGLPTLKLEVRYHWVSLYIII